MAGKSIEESITARRAAHDKRKKPNTLTTNPRVPVMMKDANGKAFTVMFNSADMLLSNDTPTFAGITSDPLPTATIEDIEYEGWIAVEEEMTTTVDWTHNTFASMKMCSLLNLSIKLVILSSPLPSTLLSSTQVQAFTFHLKNWTSSYYILCHLVL